MQPAPTKYVDSVVLGKGGEGAVFLVKRSTDQVPFVLKKRLCADLDDANLALKEAMGLAKYQSKYIVRYEDVYLEPAGRKGDPSAMNLCIVMEHCAAGDLKGWIAKARPPRGDSTAYSAWTGEKGQADLKRWLWEMAKGLQVIHDSGNIHRDIKTENIFLSADGTLKIGDFGLVHSIHRGSVVKGVEGTFLYMAPEVIAKRPYNQKADIFSLGLVYLELITGEFLSERKSVAPVQGLFNSSGSSSSLGSVSAEAKTSSSALLTSNYSPPPVPKGVPIGDEALKDPGYIPEVESLRRLVASMLSLEPEKRPSAAEIVTHPFLLGTLANDPKVLEEARVLTASLTLLGGSTRELLKASHKESAATVISQALADCPRMRYIFTGSATKRPEADQVTFAGKMFVEFGQTQGQLLGRVQDEMVQGVAVWGRPNLNISSNLNLFFVWGKMMKSGRPFAEISVGIRFKRWRKWLNTRVKKLAPPQHIYLVSLAVAPQYQRRGIGSSLMMEIVRRAQDDGLPIVAHAFTAESADWTKHFDFTVVAQEAFPEFQALKVWTLVRLPKSK